MCTYTDGSHVKEGDKIRYRQATGGLLPAPREWTHGIAVPHPTSINGPHTLLLEREDGRRFYLHGHIIERDEGN